MIGQNKIIKQINDSSLDTFPRSLILLGEKGSGRHSLCDIISTHLNIAISDISDSISFEYLMELTLRPNPSIYTIEASKISVKKQNAILKLLEEPLKNTYIIIICETSSQLLDTIINRCQTWVMQKYSKDELKLFTNNEYILDIAHTPGQIQELEIQDIDSINKLCDTIIDRLSGANYANILTIADKIDFDNEDKSKFSLSCFISILNNKLLQKVINDGDIKYTKAFMLTNQLENECNIPKINKRYLFDSYLTNLKFVL